MWHYSSITCLVTTFFRIHHFLTCSLSFHRLLPITLDHRLDETINCVCISPQGLPIVNFNKYLCSEWLSLLCILQTVKYIVSFNNDNPLGKSRPFYLFHG